MPDLVDLSGWTSCYQLCVDAWAFGFFFAAVLHFVFWMTGFKKWVKFWDHGE